MDMNSNTNNNTGAASVPHNHQQEAMVPHQQANNTNNAQASGSRLPQPQPQPQPAVVLHCPRCRSTDTKFCYFNNYSVTQPRYLCKTCRRYWTQGGTLRHVPVGGCHRKNKQRASESSSSSVPAPTSGVAANTGNTPLMVTTPNSNSTTMPVPSPTTSLFPNDTPVPTVMPTGGSGGFDLDDLDLTMDELQSFLLLSPMPLLEQAPELANGGSDTMTSFMDIMLTEGYFGGGGNDSYDGSLAAVSGGIGNNGMDMSFPIADPTQTPQMLGLQQGLDDASLEVDSYINYDGGYAEEHALGVVGDQQQEGEGIKALESSKNNNDGAEG